MWIKFGVIWTYRLEDYNVLVLEKDAETFLKTHLELKFDFQTYSNEKIQTAKWFKTNIQTHWWKKYPSIDSLCQQNCFEMSKNSEKTTKKSHLWLNLPPLKCFSFTHNFLDWYEILTTKTKLVCTTFPRKNIENGPCMKKLLAAKFLCNAEICGFWTLNCSRNFKTIWVDMENLPQ